MQKQPRGIRIAIISLTLFCSTPFHSASAQHCYSVTDLGTFVPQAINNRGQMAGLSFLPDVPAFHAFLWEKGGLTDLGGFGGTYSAASAINSRGQIVGAASLSGDTSSHAFLWERGVLRDLGTLGGTYSGALAINNRGQVIGTASLTGDLEFHAFLWENGRMADLGTLGGRNSSAYGLNERGQVVGVGDTGELLPPFGDLIFHAFLWEDNVMTDLGTLGGFPTSYATAINERGQVLVQARTLDNPNTGSVSHALLWEDGVLIDLGTLGGANSEPAGINNRGQVVGSADTDEIDQSNGRVISRAYLWEKGVMHDLPQFPGWPGTGAIRINNRGQVSGFSNNPGLKAALWEHGGVIDLNSVIPAYSGEHLTTSVFINDRGQLTATFGLYGNALLTPSGCSSADFHRGPSLTKRRPNPQLMAGLVEQYRRLFGKAGLDAFRGPPPWFETGVNRLR